MNNVVFCHLGGFGESTLHLTMPCFVATYHQYFFVRCKPVAICLPILADLAAWIGELNFFCIISKLEKTAKLQFSITS